MAARTLVAYERRDGYDVHYAHVGGDLRDRIGPGTPLGGPTPRRQAGGTADTTGSRETVVDPEPLVRGVPWSAVVADLDYRQYDRCVRVARDWTATAFLVLYAGFGDRGGADRGPVGDGALLALPDPAGAGAIAYDRGWFEGVKSATADALRAGLLEQADARAYLATRIREYAGEREVHVGPAVEANDGSGDA
jgi:hypothetical protein